MKSFCVNVCDYFLPTELFHLSVHSLSSVVVCRSFHDCLIFTLHVQKTLVHACVVVVCRSFHDCLIFTLRVQKTLVHAFVRTPPPCF